MCEREAGLRRHEDKDLTNNAEFRRVRQRAGRGGEVLKRSSHQETVGTVTEWKHGQEEGRQI